MSRGGSFGGGKSSLGYLFGSDEQKRTEPPPPPTVCTPPYGTDTPLEKQPESHPPPEKQNDSNNYRRSEGQNSGNFMTGRPSTKVNSVPGGDSSLGLLRVLALDFHVDVFDIQDVWDSQVVT
ncbi:hypothetical protein U1Q18_019668 [Sarracenia purpurea var. burkii]